MKILNLYPKPQASVSAQEIAVAASPVQFTAWTDLDTEYVLVSVKSNSVYVTFDDSTPSATNGAVLPANYLEIWSRHLATKAKFLQNSGAARIHGQPLND